MCSVVHCVHEDPHTSSRGESEGQQGIQGDVVGTIGVLDSFIYEYIVHSAWQCTILPSNYNILMRIGLLEKINRQEHSTESTFNVIQNKLLNKGTGSTCLESKEKHLNNNFQLIWGMMHFLSCLP